jgi:glucose/mannose-6-phosphate isomerase
LSQTIFIPNFLYLAMSSVLDDAETVSRLDPDGMLKAITDFPLSARKALANTEKTKINIKGIEYTSLLIAGMGGSAVGGLLLRDWLRDSLEIPVEVSRGYNLPAWVNQKTLIYAVSYSGNTEETISQYHEALKLGCTIVCFCSGGILEQLAKENHQTLVRFPTGQQPRAAIPYQFYNLAGVTRRIGLIDDKKWSEVEESINVVEALCEDMEPTVSHEVNLGKQLATEVKDYIPFIYAPRLFENVAYRYSTQFNENSKSPAATNFYPEAFHNSVMAREGSEEILSSICAVIIYDPLESQRLNKKIKVSLELMEETFGKIVTVEAKGESNLARMMSALIQGDYVSAYLGILYGIDPSTTESIELLKASMKN